MKAVSIILVTVAFWQGTRCTAHSYEPGKPEPVSRKSDHKPATPDYSTPVKTLETFLRAVLGNNLRAAKDCWTISEKSAPGTLDIVIAELLIPHELADVVQMRFGRHDLEALDRRTDVPFLESNTDEAVKGALALLPKGRVRYHKKTATIRIKLDGVDSHEKATFLLSGNDVVPFRIVNGMWKLNANELPFVGSARNFFDEDGPGLLSEDMVRVQRSLVDELRSGVLKTEKEMISAMEKRFRPFTEKQGEEADDEHQGPKEFPLVFEDDFEHGATRWQPTDAGAWKIIKTKNGSAYSQFRMSKYTPPFRSPHNISLVKGATVSDFVLEAKLQSTARDGPHRDMCLFFGYQDPAHFYYLHIAKKADDHANQIFIVNGAPRKRTQVFFDDMKTPIMTARDRTFTWGQVGVGSFDDTGNWADVRLRGKRVKGK
jgi:hypothetical protein